MALLAWIKLSLLFVFAETVTTEPQCDANHTKLLLLVEVRLDPSLTVTRITNIASYFVSRVKDGFIKNLDVCLVDPFQEKTLLNLTSVTSLQDLTSALDPMILSKNKPKQPQKFSSVVEYSEKVVMREINETVEHGKIVVVFLSSFYEIGEDLYSFDYSVWNTIPILKLIILFDTSLNMDQRYFNEDFVHWLDLSHLVFIDSRDDFTSYNPVTLDLCRDCPKGWTKYSWSGHRISCYRIHLLDTPISWLNANRKCESESSSLPAIETEDELTFLGEILQKNTMKTHDLNASVVRYTEIFNVGLHTKRIFQQNSFMWLNLRPFNLQANLQRSKDSRERCATANYLFKAINETDEIKWKTVNCDESITTTLLCEMKGRIIHDHYKQIEEALQTTLNRSNYVMLDTLEQLNILKLNESELMFSCHDDFDERVYYGFVCDGKKDCSNGRDEQLCETMTSKLKMKLAFCVNPNRVGKHPIRIYVPLAARCNFIQDCPDNSDEQGCDVCLGRQCEDGTCVPGHWLSRDREKCQLFITTNRNWYLNVSYPCKGQCSGLLQFQHEITFCDVNIQNSSEKQNFDIDTTNVEWAPKCLYMRGSDGSTTGCNNNRQLRDCRTFQCPEGFLKCPDSYCVPVYNFGDKQNDCPYGEDEENNGILFVYVRDDTSHCLESNIYIHPVHICDGVTQCPFGEDEAFCNMTCPPGFNCNGQAVNVTNHLLVPEINSLHIFDLKTKYLNIFDVDLSKLNETFILPNLLEIHASNCSLVNLDKLFGNNLPHINIFTVNLSYNKLRELLNFGPLFFLNNLQFLNLSNNKYLSKIEQNSIFSSVLHTIDLSFTKISVLDIRILKQARSIRYLNLYKTNIAQIGSLLDIKRLEYFNLQKTLLSTENITKILKQVSVSTSLYVDNFTYCCRQIAGVGTPKHACHAPPEAFSSCEDLLSDVLKRSLLWLVAGVSLAGNIMVVTYRLFYDRGVFKKGYGVFVTNLSVSDCVMGMYLLIIASTDVRYRDEYVVHESDWRHSSLCQAAGFLSTLSSETSTFFVFLITLDRYLVIRFPFGDHRFTKLGLLLCVLFVWIIGFVLASVPLMYPEWIIYSSNGMCLGLPLDMSRNLGWHYSFGIFICVNFILFLLTACGQMSIFRVMSSTHSFQMTNVQSVARRIQEIDVAKQLFLVVLSNFLCWFPICVLGFLTLTGHEVNPDTYAWLVVFVMPLNAAINPMIYTIPVMYRKWQDYKRGETRRARRCYNKSAIPVSKL